VRFERRKNEKILSLKVRIFDDDFLLMLSVWSAYTKKKRTVFQKKRNRKWDNGAEYAEKMCSKTLLCIINNFHSNFDIRIHALKPSVTRNGGCQTLPQSRRMWNGALVSSPKTIHDNIAFRDSSDSYLCWTSFSTEKTADEEESGSD